MRFILGVVFALAALLVCDAIWLSATLPLYHKSMPGLLRATPNLAAAAGFYLLYAVALSYLIVWPLAVRGSFAWRILIARAAVFGLSAYGTYDLTGLAVIRDWPWGLSLIDMGWGMVITTVAASASVLGLRRLRQI